MRPLAALMFAAMALVYVAAGVDVEGGPGPAAAGDVAPAPTLEDRVGPEEQAVPAAASSGRLPSDVASGAGAAGAAWGAAGGSVVLLGSIVGSSEGSLRSPAYAAAKAGLEGLGRSLALIGAKEGIRVNVLAPGAFDTPFDEKLFPPHERPDIPLGRMGEPAEAAGIIAFLPGDEATYVSGSVWRVDGGRTVLSSASSAGVAAPDEHTEF